MANLSRDDILSAEDGDLQPLEVPEWSGTVYVRSMTVAERDRLEASMFRPNGKINMKNISARTVVLCTCDETGKRLFTEKDADALGRKSAAAVNRIFKVAQKLAGITPEAVEDAEKN